MADLAGNAKAVWKGANSYAEEVLLEKGLKKLAIFAFCERGSQASS